MDKRDTGIKEILDVEVTRESLIALSYTEPPKDPELTRDSLIALSYEEPQNDPATECSPDNQRIQCVIDSLNCDEAERYRSALISLSYWPSSEAPAPSVFSGGFLV
ncbi:hypothetical protein Leryth_020707 [Lithospermum erythrorhizon]|nr:hypothetical protein Leryth_020707 [Lithospermum erythrorhizon]